MDLLSSMILAAYTVCSILLLLYGLNTYLIVLLFLRKRTACDSADRETEEEAASRFDNPQSLPVVTTQIPLYNELNVAERVIRAVAAIDYPGDRHEIQVLDDSDDETSALVDAVADDLARQGVDIHVLRREDRVGFKAGALEFGMERCKGEFIAIFDADFVPPKDFLKRTLPHLWKDGKCGLVQARWDHINQSETWLTRAQAVGIDGHFVVEQVARSRNGLFMNFCGTAGVWRRAAIEDSGNWHHDTVTEDLDLSYRAQLRGWRFHYLPQLRVPAELPTTYSAFKSQQSRWAKGTMQTARKVLPSVWKAPLPVFKKIQATVHLTHYSLHLLMAILALLVLPVMLNFHEGIALYRSWVFLGLLVPAALGPSLGYAGCQYYGHPADWKRRILRLPFLLIVGFGICISNARAVIEGLTSNDNTFVRTPKAGEQSVKTYRVKRHWLSKVEVASAAYCAGTAITLCLLGQPALVPFIVIYAAGFSVVGINSLKEARAA